MFYKIFLLFLLNLLASCDNKINSTQSIIFLVPKNSKDIYQLNEESQFKLNKVERKGWLIKSNQNYIFNIFLKLQIPKNTTTNTWQHLDDVIYIYFTNSNKDCDDFTSYTHIPIVINKNITKTTPKNFIYQGEFELSLRHTTNKPYYICLQNILNINEYEFIHQSTDYWLTFITFEDYLPKWLEIVIYIILVLLAAIFNGLNLGLMSLSVEELKILMKTSDSMKERKYAENILPLRKNGNFLLCSILLSITLTMSVSTLLLDNLTDGLLAGILSTLILCLVGEILPQSICSKYSLPIGSYSRKFTYFFLYLTSPVSYPFSKIIDWVLGKELPTEYNRDKIKELIKECKVLKDKECTIITGALDFKNKSVKDVMVKLDDVFMLEKDTKLDFDTMLCIHNSGFSRVPVYKKFKEDIIGWFHVKDLSLIDSNDELPLSDFMNMFKRKVGYCYDTDKLIDMFEIFRRGETHLAFVYKFVAEQKKYEKCIGIITLHDVIEALIQLDIYDEFQYNERSKKYAGDYLKQVVDNYNEKNVVVVEGGGEDVCVIEKSRQRLLSPQLRLSLLQLLCSKIFLGEKLFYGTFFYFYFSGIKPFKEEFISKNILEQVLVNELNVIRIIIPNQVSANDENHYVYKYGKACSYFVMVIEGHMIIEIGEEKTELLVKPFEYFGIKALLGDCKTVSEVIENKPAYKPYEPEYSLKVNYKNYYSNSKSDDYQCVMYLKIDRSLWLNAINTTQLKKNAQKQTV
jgi:metal transporter CNNM